MITDERKASASNPTGSCAYVGHWRSAPRKARASQGASNCALVGQDEDEGITLSNDNDSIPERWRGPSRFTLEEWRRLIDEVNAGTSREVRVVIRGVELTLAEYVAFADGVSKGEFTPDENGNLPKPPPETIK